MKNKKQKKIISEQIQLWSFFPQKPNISIDFMEQEAKRLSYDPKVRAPGSDYQAEALRSQTFICVEAETKHPMD